MNTPREVQEQIERLAALRRTVREVVFPLLQQFGTLTQDEAIRFEDETHDYCRVLEQLEDALVCDAYCRGFLAWQEVREP